MAGVKAKGEAVRAFIIKNVIQFPGEIVSEVSKKFGISRQAVNKHIKRLIDSKLLRAEGNTRNRLYSLKVQSGKKFSLHLDKGLEEDVVWREKLSELLSDLPANAVEIWHYGFTEMLNNAIDHSSGKKVTITYLRDAENISIAVTDDGEGIFKKIQRELDLNDERHAVLELSKGKLTTDPENHSGEGIFFSSRMFDFFAISSGDVNFTHSYGSEYNVALESKKQLDGTQVIMELSKDTKRSLNGVFSKFTSKDGDFGFNKTIVEVNLVRYGNELLVSRSQAKRLLARVNRFKIVIFDFKGIDKIGQAFADELFRVFVKNNPGIEISLTNAKVAVKNMIKRVGFKL